MFDQTEKQNKTKYWIKSACHVSVPTTDKLREEQMSSLYLKKEKKRKEKQYPLSWIKLCYLILKRRKKIVFAFHSRCNESYKKYVMSKTCLRRVT